MPNLEDFKPDSKYRMLFAGDSGSGKSAAAASFPGPYHELDFDGRFAGIWQAARLGILKAKNISYTQFDLTSGWVPVSKVLDQLNIQKIACRQTNMPFKYGTVGLGSLGSLEQLISQEAINLMPGHYKLGTDDKNSLKLGAPGDYKAVNSGFRQILNNMFSLPCNFIATCWIVERWGKPKGASSEDAYKPAEIIGERLNLNPNTASETLGRFDNVFKFYSKLIGNTVKYYVIFSDGDIAKNSYGIPPGEHDITGKEFYPYFQQIVSKYYKEEVKVS